MKKKFVLITILVLFLVSFSIAIGLPETIVAIFAPVKNEYCSYNDADDFISMRPLTQQQVNNITIANWDKNYVVVHQDVFSDELGVRFELKRGFNDVRLINSEYFGGRNQYICIVTEQQFRDCLNAFDRQTCKAKARQVHDNFVVEVEQDLINRIGGYQT